MGDVDDALVEIEGLDDGALSEILQKNSISLSLFEARKLVELLGRNPTMTELHLFNTQWSEHTSYKSSRSVLKMLPTEGSNVILGPSEDSGIIELGEHEGERYGIVISHESHNHPSQVVPYEGAATGVGGIIRDVLCMGSQVIATADPLRFGNPNGVNKNKVKYIANEVINGIAGYGNAVGIPNIAGDVYFNDTFDDNCLCNVVCLGLVKEKDIIHSYAPKDAEGYDIIVVGKATDNSGFGGAAFSSLVLDEDERESNRGAVQIPDPFLKSVIIRGTHAVFNVAREQGVELGFKDMGAGGIMCASSELCSSSGFGADIDLDKVHVALDDLPPYVIACSETQERFTWISPPEFTPIILKIYNEDFELGKVSEGAAASVVGTVTSGENYTIRSGGKVVGNISIHDLTSGIKYEREMAKQEKNLSEPSIDSFDFKEVCLKVLRHPNVASKAKAYKHYDKEVLGNTVIRSGEADAGLIKPITGSRYGVALSVDHNPRYSRIDPYWGAVNAVAESMRNVAAIGATPSALTDCLNFGNPEKKEAFSDFHESVRGISDAANKIHRYGTTEAVPVVSGNVSFYNESTKGNSIDPSPIISCIGVMQDYSKAVTMKLKKSGNVLLMVGPRKDELGGSVFYDVHDELGKNVPKVDFAFEKGMIYGVIESITNGYVRSCHDISDGGLFVSVAEMVLGGRADGDVGARVDVSRMRASGRIGLFSESSGFVMEVSSNDVMHVRQLFEKHKVDVVEIGETVGSGFEVVDGSEEVVTLSIEEMKEAWTSGFVEALE